MPLLNYDDTLVLERLLTAHNPDVCPVRQDYMCQQLDYLETIGDKTEKVLVAGSGLGFEARKLAEKNSFVLGIDNNPLLIKISQAYIHKPNIKFSLGDFTNLAIADNTYAHSILNFGTIGNFSIFDQKKIISELMRVSKNAHIDFYTPENTQNRLQMYVQEGWKDVRVENNTIRTADGGYSQIFTKKGFKELVKSTNPSLKIEYLHPIKGFGYVAKIIKRTNNKNA